MGDEIKSNIAAIHAEINAAAVSASRLPVDITLVAVSKTHAATRAKLAIDAGHRVFGENRVQDAEDKWPALKASHPDVSLHLIGPLQSNKVKPALALFDVIETLDRMKLARRVAGLMDETGFRPDLFVQVNTGEEPQKAGVMPADVDGFVAECRGVMGLPIIGLMCIPPLVEEPSLHFALLRDMAHRNGLASLSMGMSVDYGTAVRFGATHVRVGTAIFGARPAPTST